VINLKSKKKQNIVRVLFLVVLFFVGNYYLGNLINNKLNRETNSYTLTNVEILGTSGHWNLAPFVIDDSGGGDYTWEEASAETWCSGSGTLEEPYLIENVTIDGGNSGNCITIKNSDKYFRIENCTVFNSGAGDFDAGIHLYYVGNGTLINNNCSFNNNNGIILYHSCFNNTISGNDIHDNLDEGIHVRYSLYNTFSENTIYNHAGYCGLYFYNSHNNTFNDNMAYSNSAGIWIHVSDNNTVFNNTFSSNLYGISLRYGHYSKIFSNNVSENTYGIHIDNTRYCDIYENTIENSVNDGIWIHDVSADNNTIYANNINSNGRYGAYIDNSDCLYNEIYLNNFNDNNINAYDHGTDSKWDNGIIGNYWDDYPGYDDDFDGIGDTPYIILGIGGGQDNYPIWNFQSPIHIDDSPTSPIDWAWAETQPWCSGSGTFSDPYVIEGLNITARGVGNGILIGNSSKYFIVRNCKVIESGMGTYDAGIYLDHAGNGILINNNCSFNKIGICIRYSDNTTVSGNTANDNQNQGIYLFESDNNTVSGNTANNNSYGIYIIYSDNTTVSGNTANDNNYGINISSSCNNTISGNTANYNRYYGIRINYHSDNNTISGNTANYNRYYGIEITDRSDSNTATGNTANNNSYGIYVLGSIHFSLNNTTVSGNTANNNQGNGIYIYNFCYNTTVSGNTANNNQDNGIYVLGSDNTTISGNNVENNVNYGINIGGSDYNLIYKNYFINNGIHARDSGNFNNWNSSIIGNYWDNYMGNDDDFDGIGDTPHNFGTGIDYLPIWNFQSPIHIDDSPASPIDWAWAETQPWCFGSGTFSDPYIIDGLNITARGVGSSILIENSYKYFIVRNCKLIESGSGDYDAGIYLDHVGNGTLINNNCSFNNANGIFLYYSDNNTVSGNTANNNSDYGILLYFPDNNTISGNTANNNQENGISLYYSDKTTVSGNTAKNNRYYGISLRYSDNNTVSGNNANDGGYGISIFSSDKNIVSGNTANNIGGYGIYILYSNNNTVSGNNANDGGYGINILFSDNNNLSGNTVNNNQNQGIILHYSDNNNVSGNSVNNNQDYGISIKLSNSTTISENNIDNNVNYGIIIESGYYNLIYENYFNNNNINAYDNGTDNEWDNGVIGNYWDDYAGIDANDDGIGDTPYLISGIGEGQDNYPIWADGDDITPVITIISPSVDSVFSLVAPNYQITIVELNLDTIWYTLDGGGTNYTITGLTGTFNQLAWEALSEGNLTIRFYANDTSGNIGSAAVTVGKDISAPVITIISPLPDSVFDLVAPNYNISIEELNLDTIWYTLDGGITNYTVTGLTGKFNQLAWEALSEGSLTIRFYANDTAENIGFIDLEVIIEIPEDIPDDLDDLPIISFGNYYLLFSFITILSFIILEKRKKK